MPVQTTSHILMVRPHSFLSNPQTKDSNAFQHPDTNLDANNTSIQHEKVALQALGEFDRMVASLEKENVEVLVFQDPGDQATPDSLFPNNWISFHESGRVYLYPMQAPNRRLERRYEAIQKLLSNQGFKIKEVIDLSNFEEKNQFLEGTGSMVLDREYKIAYACLSPRTNLEVLQNFCKESGFTAHSFLALDENNKPIYHTNVMMCVGKSFVLACLDSMKDMNEKNRFISMVITSNKELIEISLDQMNHFAGNMLEVKSKTGEPLLILSKTAFQVLNLNQLNSLRSHAKLIPIPIDTIEKNGGGSVRCMMAEIHLPLN